MSDLEAAWSAVHDALARLPGWVASRTQHDPVSGLWFATAVDLAQRARGARRESLEARAETEDAAVAELERMLERRHG